MEASEVPLSVTLLGEARELLSVLRQNRRFGYLLSFAAASQPAEHPLVKEVKSLRDVVKGGTPNAEAPDSLNLPPKGQLVHPEALLSALDPFLEVVKSRDASGIITGVALLSLDRITTRLLVLANQYQALSQYSVVLSSIMDAASACRFDATDPAADEVVLARICAVVVRIATSVSLPLLSDASILRAVEACLRIAAGRRRGSDLLKRTADAALVNIFTAIGQNLVTICESSKTSRKTGKELSPLFVDGVNSPVFGFSLDTDSFSQHGRATADIVGAVVELCARMSDPVQATSHAERSLGMQLLSAILGSAGTKFRDFPSLKRLLMSQCSRAVLRSLGMFQSQPSTISAAFTVATKMVYVLQEDGAPFLLALLERVFPFYISGYENVLPMVSRPSDTNGVAENTNGNGRTPMSSASSGGVVHGLVEIDPFIREIGLEALAALLSLPGLLCVVYRIADCDLERNDVVTPLLKALGYAAKARRVRRRSKRLRASSSGANHISSATADADSDDDDTTMTGATNAESSRFSRAAALLCAESILAIIDTINEQLTVQSDGSVHQPDGDRRLLLESRALREQKAKLQHAAKVFNSSEKLEKATRLLAMLKEHGLACTTTSELGTVSEDLDGDVQSIVKFLRETPGLNKQRIGVVIGEPDALSRRILADYTATFQFMDRPFTESLRVFLESFRLPGEAQKIDRIVQSFAERYCEENKPSVSARNTQEVAMQHGTEAKEAANGYTGGGGDINAAKTENIPARSDVQDGMENQHRMGVLKNADAAYVLSYSVVMLNTDQHNDSIRKKMTLEDFLRNSRGINDGEDLPKWFLTDIYRSIAAVEIKMSDEAGIGALTDVHWDEQLRQMGNKTLPSIESYREFNEEIFTLSWESAVVAANAILNEAGDANSVQKALEGFLEIARCSTAYRMSRPTDAVISSLATATTLREGPLHGAIARFGTDIKAQMACVALSGVSRQCADWLQSEGWQSLVAYLLRLHALDLLPVDIEQQVGGNGPELAGVSKELPPSKLVPMWWPSQRGRCKDSKAEDEKPRKTSRPNGFLAALIAASIGPEVDSEEEDEYGSSHAVNSDGRTIRKTSNAPPYYLRMQSPEEREAQELARKCIAGCRIEDVIINEAKVLQSSALEHLANAVARSAVRTMEGGKNGSEVKNSRVVDEHANGTEASMLDWDEIAPPSPRGDSSAIAGVTNKYRALAAAESESDFSSFGLSSPWTGQLKERDERKARNFVTAFCIDLLCELTLQNRDRLRLPWPALHGLLVRVIAPATQPSAVLERAVVCLLRVGVRLLHRDELRNDVLRGLNLLVRLPPDTAEVLSVPIAAGVFNIVKTHGSGIHSTSGWHAILSILESSARYQCEAREIGLDTISCLLRDHSSTFAVSAETFTPLLHAILAYTSCPSIDVSIRALDLLFLLSQRISSFSKKSGIEKSTGANGRPLVLPQMEDELWSEFWGPLFLGFAASVRDPRGKVRNSALGVLERVVASSSSAEFLSAEQWNRALSTVLLPLMTQLFTTHGFLAATLEAEQSAQKKLLAERNSGTSVMRGRSRNAATSTEHQEQLRRSVALACNRTRLKAVTLTSKTFLQHHVAIARGISDEAFTELWIGVLEVFRVAIESGTSEVWNQGATTEKHDDLVEHIPESVKNLLLVMCDCGLLEADQNVRWKATFDVVREFVPEIEATITAATSEPVPRKQEGTLMPTEALTGAEASDAPMLQGGNGVGNQSPATSISVALPT